MKQQMMQWLEDESLWIWVGSLVLALAALVRRVWVEPKPKASLWRRVIRLAHQFFNGIDPGGNVPPPALVLLVGAALLASASLCAGCAGTLEETRGQLRVALPTRDAARCSHLASGERAWGAVAVAGSALSGASGLGTIPVRSHRADVALAGGAVVFAATAVAAVSLEQSYARDWLREGCAQ